MGGGQTARRWHGMGQRSADDHAGSEGCGRKPVSSIEAVARTRDDNTAISIIVVVGGKIKCHPNYRTLQRSNSCKNPFKTMTYFNSAICKRFVGMEAGIIKVSS